MNHPYTYVGCFFESAVYSKAVNQLGKKRLERIIKNPHVTILYNPQEVDETLFGEKIEVKITGYGNNGINEGLKVEVHADNEKLQEMIRCIEVPHITLSTSLTGRSVDTKVLVFEPITQIDMVGTYGGYTEENEVIID